MSNILIKAKRKNWKELPKEQWWLFGVPMQIENKCMMLLEDDENLLRVHYTDDEMWLAEIYAVEIDETTICRPTGLTDKNGNMIWENDVVEVWWKQRTLELDVEPQRYKAVVEFGNPNSLYSWGWQLKFSGDFPYNKDILLWIDMEEGGAFCEVIGNIFDNPELLEGGAV